MNFVKSIRSTIVSLYGFFLPLSVLNFTDKIFYRAAPILLWKKLSLLWKEIFTFWKKTFLHWKKSFVSFGTFIFLIPLLFFTLSIFYSFTPLVFAKSGSQPGLFYVTGSIDQYLYSKIKSEFILTDGLNKKNDELYEQRLALGTSLSDTRGVALGFGYNISNNIMCEFVYNHRKLRNFFPILEKNESSQTMDNQASVSYTDNVLYLNILYRLSFLEKISSSAFFNSSNLYFFGGLGLSNSTKSYFFEKIQDTDKREKLQISLISPNNNTQKSFLVNDKPYIKAESKNDLSYNVGAILEFEIMKGVFLKVSYTLVKKGLLVYKEHKLVQKSGEMNFLDLIEKPKNEYTNVIQTGIRITI